MMANATVTQVKTRPTTISAAVPSGFAGGYASPASPATPGLRRPCGAGALGGLNQRVPVAAHLACEAVAWNVQMLSPGPGVQVFL